MRLPLASLLVVLPFIAAACGTTSSATVSDASVPEGGAVASDAGAPREATAPGDAAASTIDGGACNLTLDGRTHDGGVADPACQGELDQDCCDQERSCGNDPACAARVACINACTPPRVDACVNACAGDASAAPPGLDAVGTCSKASGHLGDCAWP